MKLSTNGSIFSVLFLVALGPMGCSGADLEAEEASEEALTKAPSTKALVAGNSAFGTDLYGELAGGDDNLFFSPYSISTALAMTYAGARAGTASAMKSTLHFPSGDVHKAFKTVASELAKRSEPTTSNGDTFELSMANAIFGERTGHFEPAFKTVVGNNYGAGLELADFLHQPEAERRRINAWVEGETNDKIKSLLGRGTITSATQLVLVNAIYFKASWSKPFKKSDTKVAKFTEQGGGKVDVDMMSKNERMGWKSTAQYEAVAIPYVGQEVELVAVAPKAGTFKTFEQTFDSTKLEQIYAELESRQVDLSLPRFKIAGSSVKLKDPLTSLGMGVAFTGNANLKGITGGNTQISDVVHKAFIEVDEDGTEAAAATAVVVRKTTARPTPAATVRFDRPFVFAIRDVPTGSILFLGRVTKASP